MKRSIIFGIIAIAVIGVAAVFAFNRKEQARTIDNKDAVKSAPANIAENLIAAPGRVEPISEEIKLGAEISGKLRAVMVEEGDRVSQGQVIAVLEDSDYRARLAAAEADLMQRQAELRRVVNGSREQERREARAAIKEAEATMENARTEWLRRQSLQRTGDIPREETERAERQFNVAKARYEAAVERHSFIDAEAREEDRSRAEAEIAAARARIAEARALLDKTVVRSPLSGVILRKHLKTGESVSSGQLGGQSQPIVILADNSILRVRAEVDEVDVGKLRLGQIAYVKADAYGEKKFWGRVVRIGQVLGRKNVRTDEPAEKVDTKVLETLIELVPGDGPKLGLRVDAFIQINETGKTGNQG